MDSASIDTTAVSHLRQQLRQETDEIHQLLHQNSGLHTLMSNDCSVDDYVHVLQVFFQFYSQAEHFFHTIPSAQRFFYEAKPLEWLVKDFAAVGVPVPALNSTYKSLFNRYSIEHTLDAYVGYLYVKQGSTLGGQMISKNLKKTLGFSPGESQFFFAGFGSSTGIIWKEFLIYLSDTEAKLDTTVIVSSAKNHFSILHDFFLQAFSPEGKNGQ